MLMVMVNAILIVVAVVTAAIAHGVAIAVAASPPNSKQQSSHRLTDRKVSSIDKRGLIVISRRHDASKVKRCALSAEALAKAPSTSTAVTRFLAGCLWNASASGSVASCLCCGYVQLGTRHTLTDDG